MSVDLLMSTCYIVWVPEISRISELLFSVHCFRLSIDFSKSWSISIQLKHSSGKGWNEVAVGEQVGDDSDWFLGAKIWLETVTFCENFPLTFGTFFACYCCSIFTRWTRKIAAETAWHKNLRMTSAWTSPHTQLARKSSRPNSSRSQFKRLRLAHIFNLELQNRFTRQARHYSSQIQSLTDMTIVLLLSFSQNYQIVVSNFASNILSCD